MSSAKIPPKPAKDTIYIDPDDEITAIIDKVENSEHKVVALVLPKRAASLQSTVNMKLLKRSADTAGKNVVLITSEAALLPLAGAAKLHVAENLQSKPGIPDAPAGAVLPAKPAAADNPDDTEEDTEEEDENKTEEDLPGKYDYAKPIGALAARHEADNPETIDLEDEDSEEKPETDDKPKEAKKTKTNKIKVPNFDRFRLMLGLGITGFVALIVFLVLALFVLPKAKITINTVSEPVSTNFNLTASTGNSSVDSKKDLIPAKLEKTSQTGSQQVTATGQKNNGDKATGTVTLSILCSDVKHYPEEIPAGTGISSNGLTFITQSTVDLTTPGGGGGCSFTGDTDVTAQSPGSKSNLSAGSDFTIAGYSSVSGSNGSPFSGGTDDIVTVLSQNDVDAAKEKLTSGTGADKITKSFEDKLAKQGEYVLTTTLKAGSPKVTSDPSVGEPASNATVTVKVTYTVLTVEKSDLSKVIEAKLASQINKTKQKLNGNFLNDATINVQSQPSSKSAYLVINENTTAVPIINTDTVKQLSKGQKIGDIKSVINNWPGVDSVDVKLSPFWVSKVPKKDSKITVVLHETKNSTNSSTSGP